MSGRFPEASEGGHGAPNPLGRIDFGARRAGSPHNPTPVNAMTDEDMYLLLEAVRNGRLSKGQASCSGGSP